MANTETKKKTASKPAAKKAAAPKADKAKKPKAAKPAVKKDAPGAKAIGRQIKSSTQKLNLVAQTIRGKKAGRALIDLQFNKRRVAQEVRSVLQSAIANAENNHGMDVDRLIVAEAHVGKTMVLKRFHARGRGKAAGVEKKVSNVTIVVKEADEV